MIPGPVLSDMNVCVCSRGSPVLAGFLLDESEAQVVEHHEAQADSHQHQVAGVQRILVHAHGLHHLQQREGERERDADERWNCNTNS